MLKQLSSFLITLVLLPLLAGLFHDAADKCDSELTVKSEVSKVSSQQSSTENTNGNCPLDSDCEQCCHVTCAKVVTLHRSALEQPACVKNDISYLYSFSQKSIDRSTPQKPPRV